MINIIHVETTECGYTTLPMSQSLLKYTFPFFYISLDTF